MTPLAPLALARVIQPDPERGALLVALRSGQMVTARMLYQGYADPLRVSEAPMPQIGTWGLIAFPNGDARNAMWIGGYYADLRDAITADAGDPTIDYMAHWSGYWRMLDQHGTLAQQWPDGSYLVVGSGTTLPKLYRHIVDDQQKQQRVEYTMADRVAKQPGPFSMLWQQAASGLTFALDASGHVTFTGGPSGSFTLAYGSGSTFVFDSSGNVTVHSKAGATLTMDASGNFAFSLPPSGAFTVTQGGAAGDGVPLLSLLVNAFNSHTHTDPQGGTTGTPVQPLTAAQIGSNLIKLQS